MLESKKLLARLEDVAPLLLLLRLLAGLVVARRGVSCLRLLLRPVLLQLVDLFRHLGGGVVAIVQAVVDPPVPFREAGRRLPPHGEGPPDDRLEAATAVSGLAPLHGRE